MKLQTKISISILPLVALVIFAFGAWSVMTSTRGIHDAVHQVFQQELQNYVEHSVSDNYQTLVKHGIDDIDSFIESYKKIAFSDADKFHHNKTGHLMIFSAAGERLYCSKSHDNEDTARWLPAIETINTSLDSYVKGHLAIESDSQIYIGHFFPPWQWTIIYAMSDAELMAPARKIKKATILTAMACTFVGFVLIFFVLKYYIIRPVTTLIDATGSVAEFKQVERIDVSTNDELGDLARAMESMAGALQAHRLEKEDWQKHLEAEIEKRTADLQKSNRSLNRAIQRRDEINSKLSKNERFLEIILDSIQDGICVMDTQMTIVQVNSAMNLLYPDKVPLEGKKCFEIYYNRSEPCPVCVCWESLNSGVMEKSTLNYTIDENKEGALEIFAFPMQDDEGRATGVVEYVRDVTERKKMEQALKESEEKFRRIFETMQDGYLLTSFDGDILLANPSAAERLGYDSVDALMTKNIIQNIHVDREAAETLRQRLIEEGMVEAYSLTLKRQDGETLFVDCNLQLVKDSTGKKIAIEAVFRDITKQKKMIQEIIEAHELNERITSSPSLGIAVYEESGQCIFANETMARLIGANREECLQQNFHLIESWKKSGLYEEANAVLVDGCERDQQIHVISSFNKETWLNCKLTRLDKNNRPHLLLFLEDVSEKMKILDQLEERNRDLERSNKELDDFSYIASHDLKEPLRGIANYSMFLMEDYGTILDEEGTSKLETLIRLCKREESLIDSLLYYSRVGRTELAIKPVDLNLAVKGVIERLLPSIPEKDADIQISGTLPTVECDEARVGELFFNLVTNGLKYNDSDLKRVEIGMLEESQCQDCAGLKHRLSEPDHQVFFVRDNGIGIREKHIGKIFSIFKRLHGRDKYGGGTGAGLTIVEKIIKRHDGTIWVESEVGKGSTFYFTLKGESS